MYLTAHRVFSRARGRHGVNAFRYEHGAQRVDGISWNHPDLDLIATQHPGQLVADDVEVAPGGNEVLSYLDVAARDEVSDDQVRAALEGFASQVRGASASHETEDGIGIRYWASAGLEGQERDEFHALRVRALALLGRRGSEWRTREPLRIVVRLGAEDFTATLDAASATRAERARGHPTPHERVTVSWEAELGVEALVPHLTLELAVVLTRLSADVLLSLGGVRFVAEDGRTLGEWPARGSDNQAQPA
ncbi:MAG: hypothetical protein QM767_21705 [Anaeromyxobacter sp.]